MWTGDKVIPKEISVASLEPITQVLKRRPVIWDNEHANDYDQRRLYLGKDDNYLMGYIIYYEKYYIRLRLEMIVIHIINPGMPR